MANYWLFVMNWDLVCSCELPFSIILFSEITNPPIFNIHYHNKHYIAVICQSIYIDLSRSVVASYVLLLATE